MSMKIDAHQHYWEPKRGDYDWMPENDPVLSRRYLPADLFAHLDQHGIERTILVQAAASIEESEYMLGIADATESVAAVVGWVDFENREHLEHLARLARHPKFVGVRPMIQDIPDVNWMLGEDVQWAYQALIDLDLTFDALGFPQHLENFLVLLNRYPDMRVVVDHCMKPQIRNHEKGPEVLEDWAKGMRHIAEQTSAYCKFSGLVTECNANWTIDDLVQYAQEVLDAFGADRIMWGSDWPVCQLRASYSHWRQTAEKLTSHLTDNDQEQIFGGSAQRFYRIQ